MGLFTVKAPPPRNFGSEINQILRQYGKASGMQYENAATYNPMYQNLALDLYGQAIPSINSVLNSANSATRSSAVGDLTNLGPGMGQAIRGINPSQTAIYDELAKKAMSKLAAGNRLTPGQTFTATNGIRGDWAARGFASDSLPVGLDEAVALARTGDNVQGQREAFAAGVADMGNQFYTQPTIASVLGTGSAAPGVVGGFNSGASDPFNAMMAYGGDLANTNFNADAAARIATANNKMNMINGMVGAMTSY